MMLIEFDSPYLAKLNLAAEDETTIEAYITAAGKAMERKLNRHIEQAEYDEIYRVVDGKIYLKAFPVNHVARVLTDKLDVLVLASTHTIATAATSPTGVTLTKIVSGVKTTNTLLYADYPSLLALSNAINALTGYTATLAAGYSDFPSTDLQTGVSLTLASGQALPMWRESQGSYSLPHPDEGILHLSGGSPNRQWLADSYHYSRDGVRVVYTGGFATVPTDLQRVCAEIVAYMWNAKKSGLITSESLGEYSYTLAADGLGRLAVNERSILNSYKNRMV